MSYVDLKTQPPAQAGKELATKRAVTTSTQQCLVVSAAQSRRELLSQSAVDVGWDAFVCTDKFNALNALRRTKFQLALIDLDHFGETPDGFQDLCQILSETPDMLVMVCGRENKVEEEIWARQLGVWLYLPGVGEEHGDDLSVLCEQAQTVAGPSRV